MSSFNFERDFFNYLNGIKNYMAARPLILGGTSSSGGGSGGPPGGFIGHLPQTRVSYDTSEISATTTSGVPSLLDNLNHIRARIDSVTISGGHTIQDEGTPLSSRAKLNFIGSGVTVTDNSINNSTDVYITVSGGGGSGVTLPDPTDPTLFYNGEGNWATPSGGGGNLVLTTGTTLTIASGVVTQPTSNMHLITTESGDIDDLDTITSTTIPNGFILYLGKDPFKAKITIKHNTGIGNIITSTGADIVLLSDGELVKLIYSTEYAAWVAELCGLGRDTIYTMTETDYTPYFDDLVKIDATSGPMVVFLQNLGDTGNGRKITFIRIDSSGNAVTLDGNGALINGASTQSLVAQWDKMTLTCDGTTWYITG